MYSLIGMIIGFSIYGAIASFKESDSENAFRYSAIAILGVLFFVAVYARKGG